MISSLFRIRLIKIDQAVTIFGRGFQDKSMHPVVETIKSYINNPTLDYRESMLYRYHNNFIPQDTADALGTNSSCICPLFLYPWGGFRPSYKGGKDRVKSRFCGPTDVELIKNEFDLTIGLYNDIKDNGYKLISKRSIIGGTFLIREDGVKKFVVLQEITACRFYQF